jgi:GT2 family glycosyltransferase
VTLADIVIVTWNGREHTLAALEAVTPQVRELQSAANAIVVTVVDNGSSDGTASAVRERFPDVRLVVLPSNSGFTGGIAAAARSSIARYLIFLNNDAIPQNAWLAALLRAMDEAPEDVIAVAGQIVDLTGTLIDFAGGVLTFDGHAFQSGFRKPLGFLEEKKAGEELLFACGGNMIVRRKDYQLLGGFDDDFFAYLEDVDFGWRSWLSGYRIIWEPRATVRHASSATSNTIGAFERGVLFERNAIQTAIKNYEPELLSAASGPLFLTLLHRLHHYVTTRNGNVEELRQAPFSGMPRGVRQRPSLLRRVRNKLAGTRPPLASIDDDLTAMQFRAIDWFFRNSERLMAKRAEVQGRRQRSDREIFERFPLYYVPTYPGDHELMNSSLFALLRLPLPAINKRLEEVMRT